MDSVKEPLLAAFRYLLKPLVRLAIGNRVSFEEFADALARAYVDVAAKQMSTAGMDVTEGGISLIAGIPVSEAARFRREGHDASFAYATNKASPIAVILAAWHTDMKFLGPYGVLKDLYYPVNADSTERDTFSDLVNTYTPGVSPAAMLDELLRIGAVAHLGNGYYKALRRTYVPEALSKDNILYLARVIHHLAETVEFNIRQGATGGTGRIERSIFTQYGIPAAQQSAFDAFIRQRGQLFADDVDNWLTDRDAADGKDPVQIGVGFYHYQVNVEDEQVLSKEFPN